MEIAGMPITKPFTKRIIWQILTRHSDLYRNRERRVNNFMLEQREAYERIGRFPNHAQLHGRKDRESDSQLQTTPTIRRSESKV